MKPRLDPWLRRQLEAAGRIDPITPGFHVDAKTGGCGGCGRLVVRAIDDSDLRPATCDPQPLTAAGEAWALVWGRPTYRLGGHSRKWLYRRGPLEITEAPPNSIPDRSGPIHVLAAHKCDQPVPREYIAEYALEINADGKA